MWSSPADGTARPRRTARWSSLDALALTTAAADDGPTVSDDRRAEALRAAIATALTDRQRTIVEWHFFEGLSQGEIARRLGVSQQVIQKALWGDVRRGRPVGGALRRLREVLAPVLGARGDGDGA